MWDIILNVFLLITGLAIGRVYALIAIAAWRAFTARNLGRTRIGADVVALLWPVTTPALKVYDLVTTSGENVFMSSNTYSYVVQSTALESERARETAIAQAHAEWRSRVSHFMALGAEAERTQDWLAGRLIAENLDFLLETEPPRPPRAGAPKAVQAKSVQRRHEIARRETYFCNVCAKELAAAKFERGVAGICDPCLTEIHKGYDE